MPKRQLTGQLGSLHPISKSLKNLLENGDIHRKQTLAKKETLLLPKMKVNEVHFIYAGLLKGFWKNTDNEEEIFALWAENRFLFLDEFWLGAENETAHIVALEDCELYSLTIAQMNEIYIKYPEAMVLTNLLRKLAQGKRDLHLSILMKPASLRFGLFVIGFKECYNRMCVKDICVFLCICEKTYKISRTEWFLKDRRKRRR